MSEGIALRDIVIDITLSTLTIAGSYFLARAIIDGGVSLFSRRSNVQGRKLKLDSNEAALVDLVVDREKLHTTLADIGGLDSVTQNLRESVVWPFNFPELYPPSLRKPVMGILLHGPPGTGKTMIARALAAECNASFMEVKVESLFAKWVGETERNASAVFSLARKLAPVILFIDEIDSLLGCRDLSDHSAEQNAKAIFLREWDGLASAAAAAVATADPTHPAANEAKIIVIGATNAPQNLDRAIQRRMPVKFEIPLPDLAARREIIRLHLRKALEEDGGHVLGNMADADVAASTAAGKHATVDDEQDPPYNGLSSPHSVSLEGGGGGDVSLGLGPSVSVDALATLTAGFSGAQLEQLIREARMRAAREAARRAVDQLAGLVAGGVRPTRDMVDAVAPRGVRLVEARDFEGAMEVVAPSWAGVGAKRGRFG